MRVVLDTNVLLSACWKPDGNEARVVRNASIEICISDEVLEEYRDVLFRAKFAAYHEAARTLLRDIEGRAIRLRPSHRIAVAKDPDDDRFLECAEAAQATYLVTGNLRDFPAQHGVTLIVNARRFLEETVEKPLLD